MTANRSLRANVDCDETLEDARESRERLEKVREIEREATFTADPTQDKNVQGKGLAEPNSRASLRLDKAAINRRYHSTPKQRRRLMERMHGLIDKAGDLVACRAASVVIAAERADNTRLFAPGVHERAPSTPSVSVTVQVAAREAAVFGDLADFQRAANFQIAQTESTQTITDKSDTSAGNPATSP